MSTIYNPNKYSKKAVYITRNEADTLYRAKTGPLIVSSELVEGDEIVNGDSYVLGDLSANTITSVNAVTLGNNSSQHKLYGSLTISGGRLFTNNGINIQYCFDASPSQFLLYKLPRIDASLNLIPSHVNDLVTKQYADSFSSKANLNTFTGFNEFQGGIRCRYNWTSDDSGTTFTTVPKTTSDLTHLMTDDNHFITKKYLDLGKASLIASGNAYTGANTFTNFTVPNCCGLNQTTGAIFSAIPKTDLDRTGEITDDKQFITKKYLDNKLISSNNFGTSTTQTMFNTTVTNKLVVGYCLEAPTNDSVILDHIPKTRTDKTSTITLNEHLTTKLYVDNKFAAASVKRALTDNYMISECTYTYADPSVADKWWIVPPKVRSGGGYHTCYINFPPKFTVNGKENSYLTHTCTFDFTYYFCQTALVSGTVAAHNSSAPWNSTYHKLGGKPNNSTYLPAALQTNRAAPITNIVGTFTVSTVGGAIIVSAAYQAPTLYPTPTNTTLRPLALVQKTRVNGSELNYIPLQVTYVSDEKIKIELGFPTITNNTTIQNSPFYNDWISSYGATIKIKNSPPFYDGSLANTVLAPENNATLNTSSGGAYITLS